MPWQRIASQFPLEQIWTYGGLKPHTRVRELTAPEIPTVLVVHPQTRLVVANFRCDLRWYASGDFGFWKHFSHTHMHGTRVGETLPIYSASLWLDPATDEHVILFEESTQHERSA